MQKHIVRVWDLPTRLFHWLLLTLVAAAFFTGLAGGGLMVWHGRLGLAILGLLVFRLVWGFVGSTYARFAQFVPGPRAILDYLRGRWHGLGHNPLGALSVLALLAVLLFQTLSGLFAYDDIAFRGPLQSLVDKGTSLWLTDLHRQGIWILGTLIGLHLAATLFYTWVRGDNLIRPMITGVREVENPAATPARGGGLPALLFALAVAAGAVWAANGGLLPPPPPPPAPGTLPDW